MEKLSKIIKPTAIVIPQLCRNSNLLMIIVFTQLFVLVAWLLTSSANSVATLGQWSLYVQWVVVITCALLCHLRAKIAQQSYLLGVLAIVLAGLSVVFVVELVAAGWSQGFVSWQIDMERFVRVAIADILVLGAMTRFFSFLALQESRNVAESQSRIEALQSRIQPHFLFNSLNSISELTATQPEQAEQAINSLSMLFRASLENNRKSHSLENELNLCRRYVELERWRIGDGLKINWMIHIKDAALWSVPKLVIQPLIENAIVHGVQDDGSIDIEVDFRETDKHLSLKVKNQMGQTPTTKTGHGIAIENIKERLFVLYDDQQTFRTKLEGNIYSVIMRFPKQKHSPQVVSP